MIDILLEIDLNTYTSLGLEESYTPRIPLRRFGEPWEVANAAMFLMKAEYITGEVVSIAFFFFPLTSFLLYSFIILGHGHRWWIVFIFMTSDYLVIWWISLFFH